MYTRIWAAAIREVLVCNREPTNVGKYFVVKLYSCKISSYIFCVRKYFYNENKNKANYGTSYASMLATPMHSLVVNVKPLISCDEKRAVCLMSRL